jgi:peptidoglycan/xylan/chitin deacetylase (PgdA/CDA1 family)/GT2 family glycosyltransferase
LTMAENICMSMSTNRNLTTDFSVSVIIPAFNAVDTLSKTLDCLLAQTYLDWQAIIVDDGSTDQTAAVAQRFVEHDPRILAISQANAGVSVARNTGIQIAQFSWLLFLDADDWLAPDFLTKMMGELQQHPDYDAVYCDWARITPDERHLRANIPSDPELLFEQLACSCTFAIHACVVRKTCVEAVGLFDPVLCTCEEWDLWQRLARSGTKFGVLPEVLAYYRMRPNSASTHAQSMILDGLRVIEQGHTSDPRVQHSVAKYAAGRVAEKLPIARLHYLLWIASLAIVNEESPEFIFSEVPQQPIAELEPFILAGWIFPVLFEARYTHETRANQLWMKYAQPIDSLLMRLETHLNMTGLAQRVLIHLDRQVLQQAKSDFPIALSRTYGICLEVSEPIADIYPPAKVERLFIKVELEGQALGTLELPICDGWVAATVVVDAIAAEFYWQILECFFSHTIYSKWPNDGGYSLQTYHRDHGWLTFLREVWDRQCWSMDQFYNASTSEAQPTQLRVVKDSVSVEVSEDLPDLTSTTPQIIVHISVGGIEIGSIAIPTHNQTVTAQVLRFAILEATGLELCRSCVREGLVGRSLQEPLSLRQRLQSARQQLKDKAVFATASKGINHDLPTTLRLGRRVEPIGTAVSRRATLPVAARDVLLEAAQLAHESVIHPAVTLDSSSSARSLWGKLRHRLPGFAASRECAIAVLPTRIVYDPNSLLSGTVSFHPERPDLPEVPQAGTMGREFFEQLFVSSTDPWKYTTPYEQTKYEQTLSLLPPDRLGKALELACAEGHFTVQLASHVEQLLATDISQIAIDRTAERCVGLEQVQFARLDIARDPIPEQFDLIVCSEVLYYMGSPADLAALALKFAAALTEGGYLLTTHANLVVDDPTQTGFDRDFPFGAKLISDTLSRTPGLALRKQILTSLNRIQLFQRQSLSTEGPAMEGIAQSAPLTIQFEHQPTELPPNVEAMVLWHGGQPRQWGMGQPIVTERLPILMYHQVSTTGPDSLTRWRISPTAFEEQIRYLRDAGYYSVTFDDWRVAQQTKQPLPGRGIILTFDDGYLDFYTDAFPILRRYGFSATVFLVAERIGQNNTWDAAYGESVPLLDGLHIAELQQEGIEFGSHSATHRPLTGLSNKAIVEEAARSRAILTRALGKPPRSFAYPYGDTDPVVQHLIGACGYTFGLTCYAGFSQYQNSLLALSRIEIMGSDSLEQFVRKLR